MNVALHVYVLPTYKMHCKKYKKGKTIEVTYLMHVTYTTSIKQQTLCESGFSWVYMSRYTDISDSWDILLFNRRKLKKKKFSKIYLQ